MPLLPLAVRTPAHILAVLFVLLVPVRNQGQQAVRPGVVTTLVKPGVYVLSKERANLVLCVAEDASLVAGIQSPELVATAKALVRKLGAPPVRFALIMEDENAPAYRDGGWARAGAITFVYEIFYVRIRKLMRETSDTTVSDTVRGALPIVGFSNVVQIFLKGRQVHFIHERRGYSDSDVIVHIEQPGVLYLGNTFTNDGYPAIDTTRGGSIGGIITTAQSFVRDFAILPDKVEPIVPGRGPLATLKDLHEYSDMLVAVRDTIQALSKGGKSLEEIVATRPTEAFDAKWGHGPVTPEQFVRATFASLPKK